MNSTLAHRKAEVRLEDDALVRGAGKYSDDRRLPNQAAAVFVRSPHASARIVSIDTGKAAGAKGVVAVLTADDIKAAGLKSAGRHPPLRRPRRQGADPAVPADARGRARALRRRSGRHGGRRNARAGDGCRRAGRRRIRGNAGGDRRARGAQAGRAATASRGARQSRHRLAGHGRQPGERARGRPDHQIGAACRARHGAQPAHGGGLDGDARRHRRLRRQERGLHALRLLAERRHRPQPGGADPRGRAQQAARDHRGRRRRLRHEDAGLSRISRAAGRGQENRPPGALDVDAFGSLHDRYAGARYLYRNGTRARREGKIPRAAHEAFVRPGRLCHAGRHRHQYQQRRALPARHVPHSEDRFLLALRVHQRGADRPLPRRRPPGGQLRARPRGGRSRARHRHRHRAIAPQEPHPALVNALQDRGHHHL